MSWSSSMAAAGSPETSTPTLRRVPEWRTSLAAPSLLSTTGSRRSTRSRRGWRTVTTSPDGCWTNRIGWVPQTPTRSSWWEIPPGETSLLSSHCCCESADIAYRTARSSSIRSHIGTTTRRLHRSPRCAATEGTIASPTPRSKITSNSTFPTGSSAATLMSLRCWQTTSPNNRRPW